MNERAYLAQLESADAHELAQILRRPSAEEERVLEIYFGAERLEELRRLALTPQRRGLDGTPKGNVVILHGIMGGEMTVFPPNESSQSIWLNYPRLAIGAVGWLRMTDKFTSQFDVRATGILKKWYAKQLLALQADGWNVQTFFYDWRQDLAIIADTLRKQIDGWFGADADVNLVAHSMGGMVSRTYILRHAKRWGKTSRLIMLGTPNLGSFAIPQVITGAYDTIRKLALVDVRHTLRELCDILNGFPGSLQMLPSPNVDGMARLYDAKQWATWGVPQKILDVARASHDRLVDVVDGTRMSYIAGWNQVTKAGVRDWYRLDHADAYTDSLEGDGTVPHALGFLYENKKRIPTYFVECSHGDLPNNADSIEGTKQILASGKCNLPQTFPAVRGVAGAARAAAKKVREQKADEETLRVLSARVRGRTRAAGDVCDTPISREEIMASEILVREFLGRGSGTAPTELSAPSAAPPAGSLPSAKEMKTKPVAITIRLVRGRIEETTDADAIAVGHYIGVAPQYAELAIDRAISRQRGQKEDAEKLIITDMCQRGVVVGELAQNFILPDPRKSGRIIVIAGMGRPGTFGEAELAVLTRELVWALGRSERKNLATVLIGAGAGNLDTQDAVNAWLRGVRRALHDAQSAGQPRLKKITFVELAAGNFVRLHYALEKAKIDFAADTETPLNISYRPPNKTILRKAKQNATKQAAKRGAADERKSFTTARGKKQEAQPTRLTIQLQGDAFQFAALTAEASIPQRDVRVDPSLVDEANDQLPAADSYTDQLNHGNLLGRLLLPEDMRDLIQRQNVPLVLALDATTARIHWEMIADEPAGTATAFDPAHFLGTFHGLTRQLRTTFAQLPDPPVLTDRPLRVLVVADPDEDAPLPGAQEEGEAVAAIFEQFRERAGRNVEVVRLFGPGQATRVAVLDHLINQRFDMMHYAGHCFFDTKNPPLSGWIFTGGKVLSANELNRIDRVPRFIFSNACESGITPDRADKRSALLAPSFAEAFFARGVANFICTAWPIDDTAALQFARRFYSGILGLPHPVDDAVESLHEAMREARREIALIEPGGRQTWGAYQHYGDPNLRLIPRGEETAPTKPLTSAKSPRAKKRAKRKR